MILSKLSSHCDNFINQIEYNVSYSNVYMEYSFFHGYSALDEEDCDP